MSDNHIIAHGFKLSTLKFAEQFKASRLFGCLKKEFISFYIYPFFIIINKKQQRKRKEKEEGFTIMLKKRFSI